MKKITCFIASMNSGGAEHQMVQLLSVLIKAGFDVTLLNRGDIPDHYQVPDGVKRNRISNGRNSLERLFIHFFYFLRNRSDVFISFEQRENLFMMPAMFFKNKRVRVIVSERNLTYGKPSKFEKLSMAFFYKRANYIVCNSYSQRKHLLNRRPDWKDKIITITNFTDTTLYQPKPLPKNDVIKIGIFGRYKPQKNGERFLSVLNKLKEVATTDFHVDWYGNIHEVNELEPGYVRMTNLVKEYSINDVITLHDKTNKVIDLMHTFDAICIPSLYEGFSNVISEGICCGKPILAGNVSDNSVMVEDGVNGLLFNPEDEGSMVTTINNFLGLSYNQRQAMGEASRRKALELFDSQRFANSWLEIVEQ